MKVGIKYCGGCNPRYDRREFVSKLLAAHRDWDAENVREEAHYDLLYVIGGCTSCCASYSQYSADKVIKISDKEVKKYA